MNEAKLVVFWILHEYDGDLITRFRKIRKATEFPAAFPPEEAIKSIYEEHGSLEKAAGPGGVYNNYAEISGTRVIPAYERAKMETWKATQETLFGGVEWQRTLTEKRT